MSFSRRMWARLACLAGLGLGLNLSLTAVSQADLVVYATSPGTAPGATTTFDIVVQNTNASSGASYDIGGFNTEVAIQAGSGISFTGIDQNTVDPYIFSTNGSLTFAGSFTNTLASAADISIAPPNFFTTVAPGETYGLAHITLTVDPSVVLPTYIPIQFTSTYDPQTQTTTFNTLLSDGNGNPLAFSGPTDGVIAVVPEPGTMLMAGLICGIGGLATLRHQRQISTPRT